MYGSSRETIPAVREWWEAHPDVREWTKGYTKFLEVVRRPCRMSGSGWETLPDVW